jgi:predicted glycogen debranching enzyme
VAGTLTRRYHGLLTAPVDPPLGRMLVLAKADATLLDGARRFPLHTNRWAGGAVEPRGHVHIESFHLEGRMPVWRFAIGDRLVEQRIWMEPGQHTTYVAFRRTGGTGGPSELRLSLSLLVNARDHHATAAPGDFDPVLEAEGSLLRVVRPGSFILSLAVQGGRLVTERTWVEGFDLPEERARGLSDRDNHLCVGRAELELPPGQWVGLAASLEEGASCSLAEALQRFREREAALLRRAHGRAPEGSPSPAWIDQLALAADSFLFARSVPGGPEGESVIAGYPWFGEWGRDAMIALPGLALATGRPETALPVLETFARFVDRGMLPNVFPGSGETPEYNTVDAALWYIEAWRAYFEATGDLEALGGAFPVLADMVDWHCRGTRYGIGRDPADGLLRAGEAGVQLTWMDAKVGDWVVTPRVGKPVEVNALWYNALAATAGFAMRLGLPAEPYAALAEQARSGFQRFLNPANGGLLDVLDGPGGDDPTVRPNQILAVSLPASPLAPEAKAGVVQLCGRELLTSYGLRSLAPDHPDFRPRYQGGIRERDGAYHQGTVWAWLLGHYALAEYRVTGDAVRALSRLEPIRDHLLDAGLGTVSEIFDAAPPHMPRGAPAQAWSVACVLEAWGRLGGAMQNADKSPVPSLQRT